MTNAQKRIDREMREARGRTMMLRGETLPEVAPVKPEAFRPLLSVYYPSMPGLVTGPAMFAIVPTVRRN
jgi:hypothetical protein